MKKCEKTQQEREYGEGAFSLSIFRYSVSGIRYSSKRGMLLIEVMVGIAILSIVLFGLIQVFSLALKHALLNTERVQAAFLAEEAMEAVRIWRDNGWSANIASVASGTPVYMAWNGTTWTATTTNTFIGGMFERKAVLGTVYRNGSQQIAPSGTLDANTRLVTVTVSWHRGVSTTTETLSGYITNLFSN